MGLCETSNFSIFTFSSASDLKFLHTFLHQLFLSHDDVLRFEWKSLPSDQSVYTTNYKNSSIHS